MAGRRLDMQLLGHGDLGNVGKSSPRLKALSRTIESTEKQTSRTRIC